MKTITPKYKYLECLSIVENEKKYSNLAVEKAKEFINEYRLKNLLKYTEITEEQRNYLKTKYNNLY